MYLRWQIHRLNCSQIYWIVFIVCICKSTVASCRFAFCNKNAIVMLSTIYIHCVLCSCFLPVLPGVRFYLANKLLSCRSRIVYHFPFFSYALPSTNAIFYFDLFRFSFFSSTCKAQKLLVFFGCEKFVVVATWHFKVAERKAETNEKENHKSFG